MRGAFINNQQSTTHHQVGQGCRGDFGAQVPAR
jgi:hypothetical protein